MQRAKNSDDSTDASAMSLEDIRKHLAELEQRKAQLDAVLQQVSGLSQQDESLRDISTLLRNSVRQEATTDVAGPAKEQQVHFSSDRNNEAAADEQEGNKHADASVTSEDEAKWTDLSATKRRLERLGQLADRFQQLRSTPLANANSLGTNNQDSNGAGEALDERERLLSLQRRLDALRSVLPNATKLLDDDELETSEQSKPAVPTPSATERQLESALQRNLTTGDSAAELTRGALPEAVTKQTSLSYSDDAERHPRVNSGVAETKLHTHPSRDTAAPRAENAVLSSMSAQLNSTTTLCETLALGQQRLHSMLSTLVSSRAESGLTNGSAELQAASINAQLPLTVAHCQQSLQYQHAEIQQLKQAIDLLLSREGITTGLQTHARNAPLIHKNPDAASGPSSVAGTTSSAGSRLQYRLEAADLNNDRESSALCALRANVYAEASTLILQNKASPNYLVELFTELKSLRDDEQRSKVLRAVRDCALRMNISNRETCVSGSQGDLSRQKHLTSKEASNQIELFVCELNGKLEEMLSRLTTLTTVATIGAQLKTYVIDKLNASGFCSLLSSEDALDVANSRFFLARLESVVAKAISKYHDERVCDCCEELLADIADVLRTELNYLSRIRLTPARRAEK